MTGLLLRNKQTKQKKGKNIKITVAKLDYFFVVVVMWAK